MIAYTTDHLLAELYPIVKASELMPSYYKTMGTNYKKDNPMPIDNSLNYFSTMKACYGINQYNITGYLMPLWCDHSILVGENGFISCAVPEENRGSMIHDPEQSIGALDLFHTLKLKSPWHIKCSEDVKFAVSQNTYGINSDCWGLAPGITDFYNQTSTNCFLLTTKNQTPKEILLGAGSPLVKFIPLTERPINFRIEVIDNMQKVAISPRSKYFFNTINRLIHHRKTNEQRKCPF